VPAWICDRQTRIADWNDTAIVYFGHTIGSMMPEGHHMIKLSVGRRRSLLNSHVVSARGKLIGGGRLVGGLSLGVVSVSYISG